MSDTPVRYWLKCINDGCGAAYVPERFMDTCPRCGSLFLIERDEEQIDRAVGTGQQARDYFDNIRFGPGRDAYPYGSGVFMWLAHMLPGFPEEAVISLQEGFTDLFKTPEWLQRQVGLRRLYIKMEGQLPSHSFKDRGLSVAVSEALRLQRTYPEQNVRFVACASTGDTSASAAIYSAYEENLRCLVLLPHDRVSEEQLFQAMAHGATVLSIKHPQGFDACMNLVEEFCARHPEIVLVNSKNAFRIAGQETIALEICQDLRWQAPDWISIPCGNGGNLTALLVSLERMCRRGLIDKAPGIIVAQARSANTLVRWGRSGFTEYAPGSSRGETVATAMDIQDPVSFPRIKKLAPGFNMAFYDVSEEDIQRTRAMFMSAGANICPQSAVALDAVLQARRDGVVKEDDVVTSISTASGVKFFRSGLAYLVDEDKPYANPPQVVNGSVQDIEDAVQRLAGNGISGNES